MFDKEKTFKRILDKFHRGHCVVTVATPEMSDTDADRAGLVSSHAYAMLDIREVLVSDTDLPKITKTCHDGVVWDIHPAWKKGMWYVTVTPIIRGWYMTVTLIIRG